MSVQGWNPTYANAHRLGSEHSRPSGLGSGSGSGSGPTLLACRICDKIFLSTHSLIEHYETHENELSRIRHHNHRQRPITTTTTAATTTNTFQSRIPPSSITPQRYHPYAFGALNQQRQVYARSRPLANTNTNTNTTNSAFPASTQSQSLAPRHPAVLGAHNGTVANAIASRPMRSGPVSAPEAAPPRKILESGGSADKRTAWYLGHLERPIPKIIDLESQDEKDQHCNLDLTLKL